MGIRFNKSIKVGNLLKINISKSGISATVGKKGASVNIGSGGTYLNLSPTAVGIKGTGLSYRQKITSGYGNIAKKIVGGASAAVAGKKVADEVKQDKLEEVKQIENSVDTSAIESYEQEKLENTELYKYTDDVTNKETFIKEMETLESEAVKTIRKMALDGDEDTIESLIGAFLDNLDLNYEVKANYELEDHDLYVDLDLPEIENFSKEYPTLVKDKVVTKTKTLAESRKEYALTVEALAIYLAANFFDQSPYIEKVILSGFTTVRDNNGDLKDDYLYSVKFTRNIFENTVLKEVEDPYQFILKFENRINVLDNGVFKAIKPYEMASVTKANSLIDDALLGLKELGYKTSDIEKILPSLSEKQFADSSEALKEALRLLAANK